MLEGIQTQRLEEGRGRLTGAGYTRVLAVFAVVHS